jgi:predicted dienelactone hydrolase
VVLLSHGFGGTARMMGWFGTAIARAGYVVIAVDHPGNNGMGPVTQAGAALWWERAEDLKAALAAMRQDPTVAAHMNTGSIGVAGFSLGGFTSLVAAGARVDVGRFVAFCQANPQDGVCKPQKEAPNVTGTDGWNHAFESPAMKEQQAHASDDHSIPGIKAVFLMGPALVQAIKPGSLEYITARTAIVVGADDPIAQPETNADVAARAIKGATLTTLPHVKHYDFLGTCTAAGKAAVPLCEGVSGQDGTHAAALARAKALFKETL